MVAGSCGGVRALCVETRGEGGVRVLCVETRREGGVRAPTLGGECNLGLESLVE